MCLNRAAWPALLGLLLAGAGAPGASSLDPEPRDRFGASAARAVESILADVYPGSRVEWGAESVSLVTREGARRAVQFPGFLRRPVGARHLVVTCIAFPDEARARLRRLKAFASLAAPSSRVALAAAWTEADGQLAGRPRAIDLDLGGDLATCRTLQADGVAEGDAWPGVQVAYGSAFSGGDWWGWIDWVTTVDLTAGSSQEPVPLRVTKTWRDGTSAVRLVTGAPADAPPDERSRQLQANPLVIQLACPAPPCRAGARALLESVAR